MRVLSVLLLIALSGCAQNRAVITRKAECYCLQIGDQVDRINFFGSLSATVYTVKGRVLDIGEDTYLRGCE